MKEDNWDDKLDTEYIKAWVVLTKMRVTEWWMNEYKMFNM